MIFLGQFQKLPASLPHEGGSRTRVWKTEDPGTRRTRKCPAYNRHKQHI